MDTAVYFPNIRVPRNAWFAQLLLYWDQVACIVPTHIGHDGRGPDAFMRDLVGTGLLTYIHPDERLSTRADEFQSGFLELSRARTAPAPGEMRYSPIHSDKIAYGLYLDLEARGLARESEDYRWWEVEAGTADLYMAYLASALCGAMIASGIDAHPVTDGPIGAASFSTGSDLEARLREMRYAIIASALPAPETIGSVDDLWAFKQRHADALKRLRRHIDQKLLEIVTIDDEALRTRRAQLAADELRDDVELLRAQMRKKWPRILLFGVGGVLGSTISAASGLPAVGTNALATGLAVGGGLLSTAKAVYEAADILRAPAAASTSPLAYAALVPHQR